MNPSPRIRFIRKIIKYLVSENLLDDYHEWFLALYNNDPHTRRDDKDFEYEIITQLLIYEYLSYFVPNLTFDEIQNYEYYYFVVDRRERIDRIIIDPHFYHNFINEVELYNLSKPILK